MSFSPGFRWPSTDYDQPVKYSERSYPRHMWVYEIDLSDCRYCSRCGKQFSPENENEVCFDISTDEE